MSWLRSAVNKAVEANNRNKSNLSLIRNVADTVVSHAGQVVVGGANLLHDRIGNRNIQSFKHAVKRLEEVSVSCRGEERILLLRRWLVSLNQVDKIRSMDTNKEKGNDDEDDGSVDSKQPSLETYYDSDCGREQLNFRDVFLHSQALEGIVLSMILEAPSEEEVALLLEIFRLSLVGGKEAHTAIISNIQSLSKVFSSYHDEVLMKREELLQYAQIGVTGLKMNADLARIDTVVCGLKTKLNQGGIRKLGEDEDKLSPTNGATTIEALKEALSEIRMYSKLEALLLEKKGLRNGDSAESHAQKVDKMKILLESLANSTRKAERRISEQRSQKEEALHFRLAKATEVSQVEKEIVAEIEVLEKHKDELEVQLKKVNTSLFAAKTRLRNAREERDQFHNASNGILQHLELKEEELLRSIASYRAEGDVVTTWIKFMEDTWGLQSSFVKQKEKEINVELEYNAKLHTDLITQLLPAYENELGTSITRFRVLVRRLKSNEEPQQAAPIDEESLVVALTRKSLEEEYLDLETKLTGAFSLIESIKQTCSQSEDSPRKDEERVKELFDAFDRMKDEFETLEKPTLHGEIPKQLSWRGKPLKLPPKGTSERQGSIQEVYSAKGPVIDARNLLDSEEPTPESESAKLSKGIPVDEIIDWEFDALEN